MQKKFRIVESFKRVTSRGNKVVSKEFDVRIGDKNVGYLNYAKEVMDGGTEGLTKKFEKRLKKDDAAINLILVERGYMNQGIGSSLLRKAERQAKKDRKKRLVLMVDGSKKKNVAFYDRKGFKKICKEKGRKHNGEPSEWILMAKEL